MQDQQAVHEKQLIHEAVVATTKHTAQGEWRDSTRHGQPGLRECSVEWAKDERGHDNNVWHVALAAHMCKHELHLFWYNHNDNMRGSTCSRHDHQGGGAYHSIGECAAKDEEEQAHVVAHHGRREVAP